MKRTRKDSKGDLTTLKGLVNTLSTYQITQVKSVEIKIDGSMVYTFCPSFSEGPPITDNKNNQGNNISSSSALEFIPSEVLERIFRRVIEPDVLVQNTSGSLSEFRSDKAIFLKRNFKNWVSVCRTCRTWRDIFYVKEGEEICKKILYSSWPKEILNTWKCPEHPEGKTSPEHLLPKGFTWRRYCAKMYRTRKNQVALSLAKKKEREEREKEYLSWRNNNKDNE